MATATVLEFMHKTAEDQALRQQLESLLGIGDGNISTETELDAAEAAALKGERAPIVAEFAAQKGYPFSVDDLVQVVDAFQQHQSGKLSDQDFADFLGMEMEDEPEVEELVVVVSPMRRFARYMGRTYLGIN
jgi:hypothetical protein